MAESYILHETNAVCTNMTCGKPQMLVVSRPGAMTTYKSQNSKMLLTVDDRKISCSFSCRAPSKVWAGFAALCAAVAIAAACILTGGAALVVVGAALLCAGVSMGVGAYKAAHDCDLTLECNWVEPHEKVFIDQKKALLNRSYMKCTNGGLINLIIDPAIAKEAAKFITENNNKEIFIHMGSQFINGLIIGFSGGAGLVGLVFQVGFFGYSQTKDDRYDETSTIFNNAIDASTEYAVGTGAEYGVIIGTEKTTTKVAIALDKNGYGRAADKVFDKAIKAENSKNKFFTKGNILKGLGAAVVTFAIDELSDEYLERPIRYETIKKMTKFNKSDSDSHIGIIATE